jgi:hypothetical protein
MEAMPVDNVGIMQGFLEMMNEDDDEFEEGRRVILKQVRCSAAHLIRLRSS